jgi:hypothetical protein
MPNYPTGAASTWAGDNCKFAWRGLPFQPMHHHRNTRLFGQARTPGAIPFGLDAAEKLSEDKVAGWLDLYKAEYRYVTEASIGNRELFALIRPMRYEFTIDDLSYLTATQLTLCLSQCTYLLLGEVIERNQHPAFGADFMGQFRALMHAGQLYFLRVEQRMTRPILKDQPAMAVLKAERFRRIRNSVIGTISFAINGDACQGQLNVGASLI